MVGVFMSSEKMDHLRAGIRDAIAGQTRDADAVLRIAHLGFTLGGTLIAGCAQFIPETMSPPFVWLPSWQFGLGVGGACFAFLGAATTFWLQRRSFEDLRLASEALSAAEAERSRAARERAEVLEYQSDVIDALDELEQRDERGRTTATALLSTLEAVDQIVAKGGRRHIGKEVELVLDAGADTLLKGLGLDADRYCFSVFQRILDGNQEKMSMVGERRERSMSRRTKAARSWGKGEGFTGHAWNLGRVLQIADTMSGEGYRTCPTEAGTSEDDRKVYRSVICVPIRPGRDQGEPWGMITVTSDQQARFGDPENDGDIRANAVESIAKALAIMVAARYLNNQRVRR
jgi:hypothetical protein